MDVTPEQQARLHKIGLHVKTACDECRLPILACLHYVEPGTGRILCPTCFKKLGLEPSSLKRLQAPTNPKEDAVKGKATKGKAVKKAAVARVPREVDAAGNPYTSGRRRRIFNVLADAQPHGAKEIMEKARVKAADLAWCLQRMKKKGLELHKFDIVQKGQSLQLMRGNFAKAAPPAPKGKKEVSKAAKSGNSDASLAIRKLMGKKGCSIDAIKNLGFSATELKGALRQMVAAKEVVLRGQRVFPVA